MDHVEMPQPSAHGVHLQQNTEKEVDVLHSRHYSQTLFTVCGRTEEITAPKLCIPGSLDDFLKFNDVGNQCVELWKKTFHMTYYTFNDIVNESFSPYSNPHTRLLIQSILTILCLTDEFQIIGTPPNGRPSIARVAIISELCPSFNSLLRAISYKQISGKIKIPLIYL